METFGITETYDPCFDFTWIENLKPANIIITKSLTKEMVLALSTPEIMSKCIVHTVNTGMAASVLEPNVPATEKNAIAIMDLFDRGFPIEQVVLRISPIIPTNKGLDTVLKVLQVFEGIGIPRVRFSTINMYNHVKERFRANGIPLPYETYACPQYMRDNMIRFMLDYFDATTDDVWNVDRCGEVDVKAKKINMVGCVSKRDMEILGVDMEIEGTGRQRPVCLCANNKKQIIRRKPGRCEHKCLYCYWKD